MKANPLRSIIKLTEIQKETVGANWQLWYSARRKLYVILMTNMDGIKFEDHSLTGATQQAIEYITTNRVINTFGVGGRPKLKYRVINYLTFETSNHSDLQGRKLGKIVVDDPVFEFINGIETNVNS